MLISPVALKPHGLDRQSLALDIASALRFGSCALGKQLLYLGGLFPRSRCLPLREVKRVYKRLAVSKGFYQGKVYGSICYLVVQTKSGQEYKCRFLREEELNSMLSALRKYTDIPVGKG